MRKSIVSASVAFATCALFGSTVVTAGSVEDYPQKGLYAHWDAILNAKTTHDGSAKVWRDLTGSHDLTYSTSDSPNWTADAYVSDSSVVACMSLMDPSFWTELGDTWTIQAYVAPQTGWLTRYSGVCGYHSVNDGSINGLIFGQHTSKAGKGGKDADAGVNFSNYRNRAVRTGVYMTDAELSAQIGCPVLLTLVASPTSFRLYVDDRFVREIATEAVGDSQITAPGFLVGAAYDEYKDENIFNGTIHSVRVYSRTLSVEEIRQTYGTDSARFAPKGAREYEFLDFIESTGAEQIDTGIWPEPGLESDVDLTPSDDTAKLSDCLVFGCAYDAQGYLFMFCRGAARFHSGGQYIDVAPGVWQPGERMHFRGVNLGFEINGLWTGFERETLLGDKTPKITLFKVAAHGGIFKLHHFSLRNAKGALVCDYYPARRISDQTVGLYDAVTRTFKTSSNGAFTAGSVLEGVNIWADRVSVGRTCATFSLVPLSAETTPTEVVAVYSHDGKTQTRTVAAVSIQNNAPLAAALDGLKPDTAYQVYFTAGLCRYPKGTNTIDFTTLPEGLGGASYTALGAIQSTGKESFQLHLMPSHPLVTAIELTPHDTTKLSDHIVFGAAYKINGYLLMFSGNCVRFHSRGAWEDVAPGVWQPGERLTAVCTTAGFFVNDFWTPLAGTSEDIEREIFLLFYDPDTANPQIAPRHGVVKIHSCVVSNSLGGVLRDYVPARRNKDNVLGLYDRVNGEFCWSDDMFTGWFVEGTAVELPWLKAEDVHYTGRSLRATLARSAGGAADIYAVCGKDYAGENLSGWDSARKVGTFAADAVSTTVSVKLPDPAARYVRFFTSDGCWSESLTLSDVKKSSGMVLLVY